MYFGFGVNDAYFPYIRVIIKSILVHHTDEDLAFYILTDGVSGKNRDRLEKEMESCAHAELHIITIDFSKVSRLRKGTLHESAWYRVLFPEYLPAEVSKILYLDADTIVLASLKELFETDMSGHSVAGCLDPANFKAETFERLEYSPELKYICSGVLLINLDYWRQHNLVKRILDFAREHADRLRYLDQCAINFVCKDTKRILPLRYGIMGCFFSREMCGQIGSREELRECLTCPRIVHFAGNAPWKKEFSHFLFHEDWQHYNQMLIQPVPRKYAIRGWALLRFLIWSLIFHKKSKERIITREQALRITSPETLL